MASEKQFKRNNNGKYVTLAVVGLLIVGGIYAYANYDLTVDTQKISKSIGTSFDNISDDVSNSIPIKMEPKSETASNKLEDCSKFKNEIRDGTDMEEAYVALQKTKACEQRNKQIEMQQPTQGTVTSKPATNVFLHGMSVPPWTGPDGKVHDTPPIVGTFSIGNIIVSEKEYYKIISFNINIKAENLKLEDTVYLSPINFTLKNEKGKTYYNQPRECNSPMGYAISGKTGPNLSLLICYEVEKEFDKFDVFFRSENHENYNIGNFILN